MQPRQQTKPVFNPGFPSYIEPSKVLSEDGKPVKNIKAFQTEIKSRYTNIPPSFTTQVAI
jgi:hypothetical protein